MRHNTECDIILNATWSTWSAQFTSMYRIFISGLYTLSFFTYPGTVQFQWSVFCAGKLQCICRNSDVLSVHSRHIIFSAFLNIFVLVCYGLVDRMAVFCAAGLSLNPARYMFNIFGTFLEHTNRHWNCAVFGW